MVLTALFSDGKVYRTINLYRSAISAHPDLVDGCPFGRHPLVWQLIRGAHISHPPNIRYSYLWDVLRYWIGFAPGHTTNSLRQPSAKLTILLSLLSFHGVSDVRAFDHSTIAFSPEGGSFHKTLSTSVSYPLFTAETSLSVIRCVRTYLLRTDSVRLRHLPKLLISHLHPHHLASPQSLTRWIIGSCPCQA